jgi:hypothetical protein
VERSVLPLGLGLLFREGPKVFCPFASFSDARFWPESVFETDPAALVGSEAIPICLGQGVPGAI